MTARRIHAPLRACLGTGGGVSPPLVGLAQRLGGGGLVIGSVGRGGGGAIETVSMTKACRKATESAIGIDPDPTLSDPYTRADDS